jgi:hypothetical protein
MDFLFGSAWISVAIIMPRIKNGNARVFRAKGFAAPHRTRLARQIAPVIHGRWSPPWLPGIPAGCYRPAKSRKIREGIAHDKAVTPGPALQEETL